MNIYILNIENLLTKMDEVNDLFPFKQKVAEILKVANSELSPLEFSKVLAVAEPVLSKDCGCHEDLEQLELILDDLSRSGVIKNSTYKKIVECTACNRWL